MAKLQSTEIVGTTSVSNPPDGNACIWYDTAERALKVTFCGFAGGTWANRNSLATARYGLAGAGTQNAALAFGGFPTTGATEAYNGSTWSGRNSLATARQLLARAGTQNAALAFGGATPSDTGVTEAYNGSTWSGRNSLATARRILAGAGTQNAALAFGGFPTTGATEAYNGSNWASRNSTIICGGLQGVGTQNAALGFGITQITCGLIGGTQAYNGTNWASRSCSTLIKNGDSTGLAGTQNAALSFGGTIPPFSANTAQVELYNGSNWAIAPPLSTARQRSAGAGTQDAALAIGGSPNATEAYSGCTGFITCTLV